MLAGGRVQKSLLLDLRVQPLHRCNGPLQIQDPLHSGSSNGSSKSHAQAGVQSTCTLKECSVSLRGGSAAHAHATAAAQATHKSKQRSQAVKSASYNRLASTQCLAAAWLSGSAACTPLPACPPLPFSTFPRPPSFICD